MKRENIGQSLITRKIAILGEISSMDEGYFRYLMLDGDFLILRPCRRKLARRAMPFGRGEHGSLKDIKSKYNSHKLISVAWLKSVILKVLCAW